MAIRLTKRTVEHLVPRDRTIIHYDDELKGFGLRVTPAGARAWIVEYRPNGGGRRVATRRMTLGSFGTLTPDEARRRARDVLAAVRLGDDPAGAKARQRELPTFAEVAQRFLADQAGRLRPRTLVNYELYYRRYAIPQLGSLKINAITAAEIARLHRAVGREKPITANRVVRAVSSIFAYAEEAGLVPRGHKPAAGIKLYSEEGKERFLSSSELERLGTALRLAETEGLPWKHDPDKPKSKHVPKNGGRTLIEPQATAAIRLLLFTGCRLREILHLRWTDVDLERGFLFLPKTKTGKRAVVLNVPAIEVLRGLPRVGIFVIPGRDPRRPRADLNKPWAAIKRHARLSELRLHDLRHSFASLGAGAGLGLPIIGKLLGHAKTATTDRYAHLDADPLRRASEQIATRIVAAMGVAVDGAMEVVEAPE